MFQATANKSKDHHLDSKTSAEQEPLRELYPQSADFADSRGKAPNRSPATPGPNPMRQMQSAIGNQAVLRSLSRAAPRIQTKLTVNQPGDRFEREADEVAELVMQTPPPTLPSFIRSPQGVQRKCSCDGTCSKCEGESHDEDQGHLWRKETSSAEMTETPATASVHDALRAQGNALDANTRAFMEPRFGRDFSQVRIHTDEAAALSANELRARAYTVGNSLVFAAGEFAPSTSRGRKLLAHELTHVAQQAGGIERIQRSPATDARNKNDVHLAKYRGQLMAKRIRHHGKLSADVRKIINRDLEYFEDSARDAYIQEVKGVLRSVVEIEMSDVDDVKSPTPQAPSPPYTIDDDYINNITLDSTLPNCEPHIIGESWGSSMLLDIVLPSAFSDPTLRIYNFETGEAQEFSCSQWLARVGVRALSQSTDLEHIAKQLTKPQIRKLWPDGRAKLLAMHEANEISLDSDAILSAYRSEIEQEARKRLNSNEKEITDFLEAPGKVARLEQFAADYQAAGEIRDKLEADLKRAADEFFDTPPDDICIDSDGTNCPDGNLAIAPEREALEYWENSFSLLKRLKTSEIKPDKIESTLREIVANIRATRENLDEGELDVWELVPIRAQLESGLGPKAKAVIEAEDESKNRKGWLETGALTIGMIALAFVPGGAYIDLAIGFAMSVDSWDEAVKVGKAANTSFSPDEGLMSQAQASSAEFQAVFTSLLTAAGPISSGVRGLRSTRNFLKIREAFPALATSEQAAISRALVGEPRLMNALLKSSADGETLARIRTALREAGNDPKALAKALTDAGEQVPASAGDGLKRRVFVQPNAPVPDSSLPAGEGFTDKFGNITYSTAGSATDQTLALYHETVHSVLSPRLNFLRNMRADFGMWGYKKSRFLKYLEEAMAETYAQVKVHGMKNLLTGIRFPIKHGYVTLTRVVTEAAIGTVVYGVIVYGVYIKTHKDSDSDPDPTTP